MVDTNSMKKTFMDTAFAACDITETFIKVYAPYQTKNPIVAATYESLKDGLSYFHVFETGEPFEGFTLPGADDSSIKRVRILAAMARVQIGIDGYQQNERNLSTYLVLNAKLLEEYWCSLETLRVISLNLNDLKMGFDMASEAIRIDEASLETAGSENSTEAFDIVPHKAQHRYLRPLWYHHRELEKSKRKVSDYIRSDISVQGSEEQDLNPDSDSDIPKGDSTQPPAPIMSDYGESSGSSNKRDRFFHNLLSGMGDQGTQRDIETQRPERLLIDEIMPELRREDLTNNFDAFQEGFKTYGLPYSLPDDLAKKPLGEQSEGNMYSGSLDTLALDQFPTKIWSSQRGRRGEEFYSCRICEFKPRHQIPATFRRHLQRSHLHEFEWYCPDAGCSVLSFRHLDKLLLHVRRHHHRKFSREDSNPCTRKRNPVPPCCPICQKAVESWDEVFACAMRDCRLPHQILVKEIPSGALEEWQEIQTGLSSAEHSETDPSNAPSVFSLATLPSTTMTTDTRLTVDEMQTAIEELVSIFFDDTQMATLYERVLLEREVPLERFVRNFRRLIKRFAMNLQEEAREAIDLDLAQLISARARLISDKIGNKLELKYFNETQPQRHILPNPNLIIRVKYQHSMLDDIHESSSDEDDERPERITALVSHGRSFILESAAFDNLRLELRKFVIPNGLEEGPGINIQGGMFEILRGIFLWYAHTWGLPSIDWATRRAGFWARCVEGYRYWKQLLQFCLGEEDIPEKHKRFRWINRHGKRLYDDYVEHEPGALHALQEYLQATTVPNSPVGNGSQSQGISSAAVRYTLGSRGLQARASTSTTSSGDITDQSIATPTSLPAITSQGIGTGNQALRPLLLLSCIERRGRPTTLHQEYVTDITDDRQLFHTLRKVYYSHRRKFESFWSLRTLHSIHFMKVLYAGSNYIDIRCHPEICIPGQPCSCIPPATLVPPLGSTYQCHPILSKHSPPIGPRLMMDFFADPDSRVPGSDLVMQQLPKKLDTELTSDGLEVTEAWGIFYREE